MAGGARNRAVRARPFTGLALAATAWLAACNSSEPQWERLGGGDQPAVSVTLPVSAEAAYAALGAADGEIDARGLVDVPPIARERPEPLVLHYVFNRHSPGGDGSLTFRLVPVDAKSSRVELTTFLPANVLTLEGEDWSISQGKVQRLLEQDLQGIAADLSTAGQADEALDRLDVHIAAIAVAMSPPAAREATRNGVTFDDLERNVRFSREDAASW